MEAPSNDPKHPSMNSAYAFVHMHLWKGSSLLPFHPFTENIDVLSGVAVCFRVPHVVIPYNS